MVCNNKYMYTKENWNPNVYDLNIDYKNIAENRRTIFTDELQEVANKALPCSQKAYVQYSTKKLTQASNNLKFLDDFEFNKTTIHHTTDINEFRHDTATYEYTDLYNIKRTKNQEIYTTNINLTQTKYLEICLNENIEYDTAITMFFIQQGSHQYILQTPTYKNNYQIRTSTTQPITAHIIGLQGNATLDIRTNNTQLFKEVKFYT